MFQHLKAVKDARIEFKKIVGDDIGFWVSVVYSEGASSLGRETPLNSSMLRHSSSRGKFNVGLAIVYRGNMWLHMN